MLPVLDGLFESTSWQELGTDYMLTREQLEWALEQYAPGVDRTRALLSPLRAESFADLPPTTVAVGEFDPLRDEGLGYAERLREAGVPVSVIDMPGLIHHALLVPKAIDLGRQFVLEVAEHLGAALGTPGKSSARTT